MKHVLSKVFILSLLFSTFLHAQDTTTNDQALIRDQQIEKLNQEIVQGQLALEQNHAQIAEKKAELANVEQLIEEQKGKIQQLEQQLNK